jgi:hypothetical protein
MALTHDRFNFDECFREGVMDINCLISIALYYPQPPGNGSRDSFSFSRFYAPSFTQLAKHSINDITQKVHDVPISSTEHPIPDRGQITTW